VGDAANRVYASRLPVASRENPNLVSSGAGLAAAVAIESGPEMGEGLEPVRARGYWEQVWIRFKKDKVAIAGGLFILFVILAGFVGAPVAQHFLGHGPGDLFTFGTDPKTFLPVNPWTHVSLAPYSGASGHFGSTLFILGGDSQLGRDEFLRLLYGTQVSLEVAVGATLLSMFVGVLMGSIAGYFGGWIDTIVSRLTDITMAFPLLLFIIALASTAGPRLDGITLGGIFEKGVIGITRRASCAPRCSRYGRRSSWRRHAWSARATCGSSARICCRTSSLRSSFSRPSPLPSSSSPRPAFPSSASGSRSPLRAGAACSARGRRTT
jgi:hypothetical protein